ncbi:MAG: hypothetical protein ABSB71_12320 [Candidatus Bathyarchaeia archaeon]|jgi:hypothetical protein
MSLLPDGWYIAKKTANRHTSDGNSGFSPAKIGWNIFRKAIA